MKLEAVFLGKCEQLLKPFTVFECHVLLHFFFIALLTDLVFWSLPLSVCARMRICVFAFLRVLRESGLGQENVFGAVFCCKHIHMG